MAVTFPWDSATSRPSGISNTCFIYGTGRFSTEIDNATFRDTWLALELLVEEEEYTPTANKPIEIFLLYAFDGTNYETGNTSTKPLKPPVATMLLPNTFPLRQTAGSIPLAPFKLKLLVFGGDFDEEVQITLKTYTYREQVATA